MKNLTDRQIRRMSYQERQAHYIQEKNELFYSINNMTAEQVREAHDALIRKWRM